jgi:hypothetical protein
MTINFNNAQDVVLLAIDITKAKNDVLVQLPNGARKKFKMANKMSDYREFIAYLSSLGHQCHIGLEATSNYHRPIAYQLQMAGLILPRISGHRSLKFTLPIQTQMERYNQGQNAFFVG